MTDKREQWRPAVMVGRLWNDMDGPTQERVVALRDRVLQAVRGERHKQDARYGYLREQPADDWLAILGEEVAELIEALEGGDPDRVSAEAVQVAAVASAIAEAAHERRIGAYVESAENVAGIILKAAGILCRRINESRDGPG